MIFGDVLKGLGDKLDGLVGVVVMGMDGIPIERHLKGTGPNFDILATEATGLLRSSVQASNELNAGNLKELVVQTDGLTMLAVAITEEYVLLAALRPDSNYGRARFYLKRAALTLEKEFV